MSSIHHNGVSIDYQLSVPENQPGDAVARLPITLLFVHGSYIDQTYWNEQVRYFNPAYKVVTLDLPGQGNSGRNRQNWNLESYAEDVIALIKELDLQQVILIGHSMGGGVVVEAAVTYPAPIIGLIVIDFFKNAATPMPENYQKQIESIKQGLETAFADTNEQYARQALLTPETPAWLTDRIVEAYRGAYPPMGRPITNQLFSHFKREQEVLPKLLVAMHLINVDYQPTNEEPLQQYVKAGYDLIHLPGTSHYPMIESPELLNCAIEQALEKILNSQIKQDISQLKNSHS